MSSADHSNFDIDYSIPSIEETPTLEEILTKEDDDSEFLDQLITQDLSEIIEIDDTNLPVSVNNDVQNSSSFNVEELTFIKNQLALSRGDRIDSGKPTALTVSKNFISIGTFNGHVLLFLLKQKKLSGFCKHEKEFGSITSLSINKDETRLVCGGSRGLVSLWNLNKFEIIRQLNDLHAPFSSILNIQYLSNHNFAILNDSSGSVFVLDVRRKNLDSHCVFSGSRGEALMLKPLSYEEIPKNVPIYNGIDNLCLLAMATVSKVIVISIRPAVVIHFTFNLKGSLDFLPLICWNLSFDYNNEIIPLLSFARQDQLYIHRMVTDFVEKIDFIPLFQFTTTNYYLQQIFWLDNDKLFLMDTTENGHLIDVAAQEELERIDLSNVELIYESANYKSLAMGGYVSRAMANAGQHACNNSFFNLKTFEKNQLFMLGLKSVFVITLRDWNEKVSYFIAKKDYLQALKLLYDNYLSYQERRSSSMDSDVEQIFAKMDQALTNLSEEYILNCKNVDTLRETLSNYVKYSCCLPDKHEKLFELYAKIPDDNSTIKSVLIECLERYIFDDDFPSLNPIMVREIIDYYLEKEWYKTLDSLITHLDISSLDIDHLIRIYPQYHLYDSFIYIYNFALRDFIHPLDCLLNVLKESISPNQTLFSKEDIIIGNKLLVYLNCMLTCVYYPNKGKIPEAEQVEHLNNCYKRLTKSSDDSGEDRRFDIFNVLFQYDCIEFLNTILIAFDYLDKHHRQLFRWKQILVDKLIEFFLEDNDDGGGGFDSEQRNSFFIFLGRCSIDFDSIKIKDDHFQLMIDSLFEKNCKRLEERQQILIQIFKNSHLNHRIDVQKFLQQAEQNQMFKLCELIYQKNRDWISLFGVYLNDPTKHDKIFNYIDFIVSQKDTPSAIGDSLNQHDFLNKVFENFHYLVQIDCLKSSKLFGLYIKQCDNLYQLVVDNLQCDTLLLYQFLKEIVLKNRLEFGTNQSYDLVNIKEMRDICFSAKNQQYFIELTCQIEPENLVEILDSLNEYDPVTVLDICRQFRNHDGEAYLLEKMKQFDRAFSVLFENFKHSVQYLIKDFQNKATDQDQRKPDATKPDMGGISKKYFRFLSFCDRVSQIEHDKDDHQKFWLQILEYLIKVKGDVKNISQTEFDTVDCSEKFQEYSNELNKCLRKFFENLINDMLTHLNFMVFLEIIMNKILKQSESMCDFREVLLCILENYTYEKTLLELTTNILSDEHRQLVKDFLALKTKCKRFTQPPQCQLCTNYDGKNYSSKFIVLKCDHLFHLRCLERMRTTETPEERNRCPVCHKRTMNGTSLDQNLDADDDDDGGGGRPDQRPSDQRRPMKTAAASAVFNEAQLRILNQLHNGRLRRFCKR